MQPEDVLTIGILVADFLFNTRRWSKALVLLIDCLVLLKGLTTCEVVFPYFYREIYSRLSSAGNLLNIRGLECFKRSQFGQSIKYHEKALFVFDEISSRSEEAFSHFLLGRSLSAVFQYDEAIKHYQNALQVSEATGVERQVLESGVYYRLGEVCKSQGKCDKALSYYEKALAISKATGNKFQEAVLYHNLGLLDFKCLDKFDEALVNLQKALKLFSSLNYTKEKMITFRHISEVYRACGECEKALEYSKKSLPICKNLEDQGIVYKQLCSSYLSLHDTEKVIECSRKYAEILQETGDRKELGLAYAFTGIAYKSTSFGLSLSYLLKSLQIHKDSGDRYGEALSIYGLGWVCFYHGQTKKALEYVKRAIDITEEAGGSKTDDVSAASYALSSIVYAADGQIEKAIIYLNKALGLIKEAGTRTYASQIGQFAILLNLGSAYLIKEECSKARDCFLQGIETHIKTRSSFKYDMIKIALDYYANSCYKALSWLLLGEGKVEEALFTLELGRSCALIDLLSEQYGIQGAADVSKISSSTLQSFLQMQQNNFLFIAALGNYSVGFWFVDKIGNIKLLDLETEQPTEAILKNHDVMQCEDRSLSALYDDDPLEVVQEHTNPNEQGDTKEENTERTVHSSDECAIKALLNILGRLGALMHRIADMMDGPEIIIAPEGPLFMEPFAALQDEKGNYLSEGVRIRLVPSLTTLKLIQDSSADYHCNTGALIVGDPKVGPVEFNGKLKELDPLPCAREESEMISRLLGVPCLVGEQATKEEVLRRIQEVSLVHIAAHGDAERGEIALAPNISVTGIPTKEDFMLTMKDIAEVGIRAKLVVLSCCHSACGKILTAEGVVGIARAFLGSGARSVLMSLWAVDDEATKAFMEIFYKCLIQEKMSASEALHQAMKQMREKLPYKDVKEWAPFVLLGDDVSFDFKK